MHSTLLRCVVVTSMLAVAGAGLRAQDFGFTCIPNVRGTPTVRVEDITALVGELNLNCRGGTPTPVGQTVPLVNVQIFLNTNVTSQLLMGNNSEAFLIIDEPSPSNQRVAASGSVPGLIGLGGNGIIYSNPGSTSNQGQNVRNVYQGRLVSPNSVVWLGVPVDPPGPTATRIIRITNVRANANQLGVSSTLNPTEVKMFLSATGITITNPLQTVATVQPGMIFSVPEASSEKDCVAPSGRSGLLRYREGFASSFRRRSDETGFNNSNFPNNDLNGGNLGAAGRADHGTLLKALFNNVPSSVQILVGVTCVPGASHSDANDDRGSENR